MGRYSSKNRKWIFILFLLAFSFFVVKISDIKFESEAFSQPSNTVKEVDADTPLTTNSNIKVYETSEGTYSFDILPVEQTVDITEEIKGATSCEQFNNSFNVKQFCRTENTEGRIDDVSGGGSKYYATKGGGDVSVDDDVEIKLVKVTYPSQLANGSKVVKDNTKDITIKDPVYKSFGDAISAEYADRFKTSVEVENGDSFVKKSSQGKTAFQVLAENTIAKANSVLENVIGKYVVEKEDNEKYCSFCTPSIQPSFFNPKPSNDAGTYLDSMMQIPGGDPSLEEGDTCIPTNENMSYTMTAADGLETLCADLAAVGENPVAKFLGNLVFNYTASQWSDCNTVTLVELLNGEFGEESDECFSVEDIVIEMSSVFGATDECKDGVCTNAFMTRKFQSTLTPVEISGYTDDGSSSFDSLRHYVLTPCEVEITSKNGVFKAKKDVSTLCMWDTTPILANYRLLQAEKAPKQEDFPQTFESYWDLVMQGVKKHSALSIDK